MQNLPKIARERLKTAIPTAHPDADLLTAFSERALGGRERDEVMEHLTACSQCREVVLLAQPPASVAASPERQKLLWYNLPALRWSTAAALVLIVGSAIMLKQHRLSAPTPSTADVSAPHQQTKDELTSSAELALSPPASQTEPETKKAVQHPQKQILTLSKAPRRANKKDLGSQETALSRANSAKAYAELGTLSVVVPAPAPPGQAEGDRRTAAADMQLPNASENVDVAAAAPTVSTEMAEVSKAKEPAAKARAASPNAPAALTASNAQYASAPVNNRAYASLQQVPLPRWTLAADGGLQRSLDAGKTWEKVTVHPGAVFRAVSAQGAEIWAGGAAGLLYHSSDAGRYWKRVQPLFADQTLSADIVNIEFRDVQHGHLTTTDGQVWTTADAGQSWQKQ